MSPRPRGRRTVHRKITLFQSEIDRVLENTPAVEDEDPIKAISLLCRDIATGVCEVQELAESDWEPPELVEARQNRAPGQRGRTKCSRVQRDVLFYPSEYAAFERHVPRNFSFQEFWRSVARGDIAITRDKVGERDRIDRRTLDLCELCGKGRTDNGEYCAPCRGVDVAA